MIKMSKMYIAFKKIVSNEKTVSDIINNISSTSKAVSLLYNLKKYEHIRLSLENGELDPVYFATKMTHDEMTGEKKAQPVVIIEDDYPDGLFKCENCRCMKTEHYEVHNIETTITYITCMLCGHKWKI